MRKRPDKLLNGLNRLSQLQQQHHALLFQNEMQKARQEVLESMIQDQDHVTAFKRSIELHLNPHMQLADAEQLDEMEVAPAEQQTSSGSGSGSGSEPDTYMQPSNASTSISYVVSLLQAAEVSVVQQVLGWDPMNWHHWLADAAHRVCLLLQLTARTTAASTPSSYVSAAEEELSKAVDDIVTIGTLAVSYVEVTGRAVGICTSLNHMTMQEEAPAQDHWQNVLQQLDLSRAQLVKLAACYQEFARQRKAHHALQESLTKAVASTCTCTQQLLAAARGGSVAAAAVGTATGDSTCQQAAAGLAGAVNSSRRKSTPDLAGAAAAMGDAGPAGADADDAGDAAANPEGLLTRLLVTVNQSSCMPFLFLHNTLTRKQIARMLVASYPFVPRPGPLMEAASQHLAQLKPDSVSAVTEAADDMQDVQD